MCDCHIDQVQLDSVPLCVATSFSDLFLEFSQLSRLDWTSFSKNDRIYYVILVLLLLVICMKSIRHRDKQSYEAFWE